MAQSLLASLPNLLTDTGALMLMSSSVSHDDIMRHMPTGFEVKELLENGGRRVPLDLDNLWQSTDWRKSLVEARRLEVDGDGLWHWLKPVLVSRKKDS